MRGKRRGQEEGEGDQNDGKKEKVREGEVKKASGKGMRRGQI